MDKRFRCADCIADICETAFSDWSDIQPSTLGEEGCRSFGLECVLLHIFVAGMAAQTCVSPSRVFNRTGPPSCRPGPSEQGRQIFRLTLRIRSSFQLRPSAPSTFASSVLTFLHDESFTHQRWTTFHDRRGFSRAVSIR